MITKVHKVDIENLDISIKILHSLISNDLVKILSQRVAPESDQLVDRGCRLLAASVITVFN